jgi:hypothetical protein
LGFRHGVFVLHSGARQLSKYIQSLPANICTCRCALRGLVMATSVRWSDYDSLERHHARIVSNYRYLRAVDGADISVMHVPRLCV